MAASAWSAAAGLSELGGRVLDGWRGTRVKNTCGDTARTTRAGATLTAHATLAAGAAADAAIAPRTAAATSATSATNATSFRLYHA
jgi:hypothetical protein